MNKTCDCLTEIFLIPRPLTAIAVTAMAALAFAYVMQYGFGVAPCVLCMWQRLPFALAMFAALVGVFWKPYGTQTFIILLFCALTFAVGAGLAIFHTGVEQSWWLGTSGCAIQPGNASSVEDLRTQLLQTVVARCDQISWTFLGLSMANWNIPLSLGLSGFSLAAAFKK